MNEHIEDIKGGIKEILKIYLIYFLEDKGDTIEIDIEEFGYRAEVNLEELSAEDIYE